MRIRDWSSDVCSSDLTAWENQVRSRLFMERPADTLDRDVRVLSRQKANYAQNGEEIAFRWHEWAFILEDELPNDQRAEIAAVVQANRSEEHTSELQSLMRISYAVFCLIKKKNNIKNSTQQHKQKYTLEIT